MIVVTRHPALIEYLKEKDLLSEDFEHTPTYRVLSHATAMDVSGQHVIGVLPLHLAALATQVTEIPLDLTPEQRGKELTLEEVRAAARPAVTYRVFTESAWKILQEMVRDGGGFLQSLVVQHSR